MITAERVRELLSYDPETGIFIWRKRPGDDRHTKAWNRRFAGNAAGSVGRRGYRAISVGGHRYLAHRLAVLHATGGRPSGSLDHEDGNRDDNRLSNLRLASSSQNQYNQGLRANNKSGRKGVSWQALARKWQVCISVYGKTVYLGLFADIEEAAAVYAVAAITLHGTFMRPPTELIKFDITPAFLASVLMKLGMTAIEPGS